ncbi:MAG: bacterioferritin [Hyphomicrobiaceae bacterium]
MKGDPNVLKHLQTALGMELTAVRQYLLHAHLLADWGLDKLSAQMKQEMQEELGHADQIMTRMMFLEGEPDMKSAESVNRAKSIKDMLEADLQDEIEARRYYTAAARAADEAGDLGTRDLFQRLTLDEEGHIGWLETQLALLGRIGEAAYLQMQVSGTPEAA